MPNMPQLKPSSKLYRLLQVIIFPLFMFGPPIIAHQLISAGWAIAPVVYVSIVVLIILMLIFEHLMPYRPEWNQPDEDVLNDIGNGECFTRACDPQECLM